MCNLAPYRNAEPQKDDAPEPKDGTELWRRNPMNRQTHSTGTDMLEDSFQ